MNALRVLAPRGVPLVVAAFASSLLTGAPLLAQPLVGGISTTLPRPGAPILDVLFLVGVAALLVVTIWYQRRAQSS